jgi:iron complex outermembrane receptor protein
MRRAAGLLVVATLAWAIPSTLLRAQDAGRPAARADTGGPPSAEEAREVETYRAVASVDPHDPAGTSERRVRRADLERQGAGSAAAALERLPSVYATTGARNERILSIRGFDQRQTAVLVDGAPAFIAYDGQVDLGMLPAALVEQITVSRGPGTLVVGPNGLGPTVSIVTRRPGTGPLAQGRLEGSFPLGWRGSVIHSQQLRRIAYTVYAGGEQSEGFRLSSAFLGTPLQAPGMRLNSDREGYYAGGSLLLEPAAHHELLVSTTFTDADKGVPPSALDDKPRYWRFNAWRGLNVSLSHAYRGALEVESLAYARLYDNLLDAYDDNTFTTQHTARAFHSWYFDRSVGLILRMKIPLPALLGAPSELRALANVAYDYHRDDPALPAFERALLSGAAEWTLELTERLAATVACQVDSEWPVELRGESSTDPVGVGPLVAVRYEPVDGLAVSATIGRRHRFPSLKERFSRALGTRLPNPGLAPESAWHFGLEASWRATRWLSLDASVFDAEVTDLIDRVYLGGGIDQLQNVTRVRLAGGELGARVKLKRWLHVELGYAFLSARRLNQIPDVLSYRPAHKGGLGVVVSPWSWLDVSSFARVIGPQSFLNPTTLDWGTLGGYAVWDAQLEARPWKAVALYARATNLLDASYQTEYGFPEAGRSVWVGVRVGLEQPSDTPRGLHE